MFDKLIFCNNVILHKGYYQKANFKRFLLLTFSKLVFTATSFEKQLISRNNYFVNN